MKITNDTLYLNNLVNIKIYSFVKQSLNKKVI